MYRLLVIAVSSIALVASTTGCKVVVPNATTVEGLSSLEPGMNKEQVLVSLEGVYPHDIFNGEGAGCEVHEYRFKRPYQDVKKSDTPLREGLRGNPRKFVRTSKAYAIYRDGVLETVFSEKEKDYIPYLLVSKTEFELRCNPPAFGCTDSESVNYNASATVDDGSCVYCPCGFVKNTDFNPNRVVSECNQPCLKDDSRCKTCPAGQRPNPNYDWFRPESDCNSACIPCVGPCDNVADLMEVGTCGPCDLIEVLSTVEGASINLYYDINSRDTKNALNHKVLHNGNSYRATENTGKSSRGVRKSRKKKSAMGADKPLSTDELRRMVDVYSE